MSLYIRILFVTIFSVAFFTVSQASANECVIKEGLVFCGSKDCRTTSQNQVACGGMAKERRTSSNGNVACGGQWNPN